MNLIFSPGLENEVKADQCFQSIYACDFSVETLIFDYFVCDYISCLSNDRKY